MSELLKRLRGQGELECRGEFSLDVDQAQLKMSHFQLPQAYDFLYHLVAGLFRLGASRLHVFVEAGRLILELPALNLPARLLEELPMTIFEEASGYRRLAAASQSLLAFKLVRFDWLGTQKDQHYDYLTRQGQKWQNVSLRQVQIEGLPGAIVEQALAELARRGCWSRRPLQVGERRFQRPRGLERQLGGYSSECEWSPGEKPQLLLIMDEMATQIRPVEAPFAWTGICYGEFRLDASLAQVVEEESFQKILDDIPGTFHDCIRLGLRSVDPDEILRLLVAPLPAWLEPLREQLFELRLFQDQRGKVWSLAELLEGSELLYYAEGGVELQQLEPTILVKPTPAAMVCLKGHLGPRLQNADQLVLRKLQREHNRRIWEQQSVQSLALSRRYFLVQQEFTHERARWLVGIPDDWSQSGTSVTLWVEGRKLTECKLILQEFAFEIACEIAPDHVNELWTGLDSRAWSELEPRWNESIQQVMQALSSQDMQSSLRHSLKKHLAGAPRPEFNYFHKTLLFQDWHGNFYSLDQLLSLEKSQKLGVVDPQYHPLDFVSPLIPEGVYLRESGFEWIILQKQRLLNCVLLDHVLEDFLEARRLAFDSDRLVPQPAFGAATVHFCKGGVCLAPLLIDSPLAFDAWVCSEEIDVQTVLYNSGLGPGRFKPIPNERTAKILADLQPRLLAALEQQLRTELDETWLEWLRQGTLRGLCSGFLVELGCWPCYPQGRASLRDLREARLVYWCSGEVAPQACQDPAGEILLFNLSSLFQAELATAAGAGEWICLDEAFARELEHEQFLARPFWSPNFSEQIAPPKPDLWLVADGVGRIYWLFQGRLIEEETGTIPFGFRLAVNCPSLLAQDWPRQDLVSKCYAFLREWLALPRPSLWEHWQQWMELELPEGVSECLRRQPWFTTSRGARSWKELMEEAEIWLFLSKSRSFPAHMTVVFDRSGAPQTKELFSLHPGGHGMAETEQELRLHDAQQEQRQLVQQKSRRLLGLRYRATTRLGEIALSGENTRDVWLISQNGQSLVNNLPAGLVGFLLCPDLAPGPREVVELGPEVREELSECVADLLIERVAGSAPLQAAELDLLSQVCQQVPRLDNLRWIVCADGSYASLQQLRQEGQERKELGYWPRDFRWRAGGPALLPILSTPLMLEMVGRACQVPLRLSPPPLLYREVPLPTLKGIKEALSALAQADLPLLSGIRKMLAGPPAALEAPEVGQALLLALRRRAGQLLSGTARTVCLHHLENARLRPDLERLWQFQGQLLLCSNHPALRGWLGPDEPPLQVQTSLLLSLVCACNAMSLRFSDEMEREFLEQIARDMVDSLPRPSALA